MKVFVSSLITGMEDRRAAARKAITDLGHAPVMAEDFGARPQSPQVACLSGLRESALVVLILGREYGAKQASGLSATHEEYREARDNRPVLAFVQEGIKREPEEDEFVREVQTWQGGLFRSGFRDPQELGGLITRAVHQWELSHAAGPLDSTEMIRRALCAFPESEWGYSGNPTTLAVSIVGGPTQSILRPSEIEDRRLNDDLLQAALFGPERIFTPDQRTKTAFEKGALVLSQEGGARLALSPTGDQMLQLPVDSPGWGPVVIEENITRQLAGMFGFASRVLERIDPTHRLSHVAIAATFLNADSLVWRTRAEQDASPNSYEMNIFGRDRQPVHLAPPDRPRAALQHDARRLVEDFVTLLRRTWK